MKPLIHAALAALLLTAVAAAQGPQGPPKPAPEMERTKYLLGTWNQTGTSTAGPCLPFGGKFTGTERNEMGLGGFFMVTHSTFSGGGMRGTGVAYLGYDPNKKVYTYNEFSSMGEAQLSTGNLHDKVWTWTNESEMGGKKIQGRFTLTEKSPTSYTMKYECSTDGGNTWNVGMEGTGTKQGAAALKQGESKKK
jgi:hypothetical protein